MPLSLVAVISVGCCSDRYIFCPPWSTSARARAPTSSRAATHMFGAPSTMPCQVGMLCKLHQRRLSLSTLHVVRVHLRACWFIVLNARMSPTPSPPSSASCSSKQTSCFLWIKLRAPVLHQCLVHSPIGLFLFLNLVDPWFKSPPRQSKPF
jgi:hypothetical protein